MSELEQIPGSGNEGRVTKKDILQYIAQRGNTPAAIVQAAPAPTPAAAASPAPEAPAAVIPQGNVELIEMDRMNGREE